MRIICFPFSMQRFTRMIKIMLLLSILFTVTMPMIMYTDIIGWTSNSFEGNGFGFYRSSYAVGDTADTLKSLEQKSSITFRKSNRTNELDWSTRVSSADNGEGLNEKPNIIYQETSGFHEEGRQKYPSGEKKHVSQSTQSSRKSSLSETAKRMQRTSTQGSTSAALVHQLKDQLISARVALSLGSYPRNSQFTRELRLRMREVQRVLGEASKDSELPKRAHAKLKAIEQTLEKGKYIQNDCPLVVKKLRAMIHLAQDQLETHKRQETFLTKLTAKTMPRGIHCLPLRLSTEYFSSSFHQKQFPNQDKLENPELYHYALFSDNILATGVVVNSTVIHAKEPSKHVFHIVTDRVNYAAMRMWFLVNPPNEATINVQNIEEFTWLNASYSPVMRHHEYPSVGVEELTGQNVPGFRNPKYLSTLNYLRFYLPEVFPKLKKVLFLDDDVVVQKDLSTLWMIDMKGNVNGAVETCGEVFHLLDRFLNFSNPLISKILDGHACGWAYGMNLFDLDEWRSQNLTGIYHAWKKMNEDRQLWKLGSLPPGLLTFWNRTLFLDPSWHVLGLGYNPNIQEKKIKGAAVIHYNGNMKPWLDIAISKYRYYWTKFVNYDQTYLQECNINP